VGTQEWPTTRRVECSFHTGQVWYSSWRARRSDGDGPSHRGTYRIRESQPEVGRGGRVQRGRGAEVRRYGPAGDSRMEEPR
jgi:hypothetical protein